MGEKNSNDVCFSSYSPSRLLISCALLGIFRTRGLNQNIILSPYTGRYMWRREDALAGRDLSVCRW